MMHGPVNIRYKAHVQAYNYTNASKYMIEILQTVG